MKRDFTEETKKALIKELNSWDDVSWWEEIKSSIKSAISVIKAIFSSNKIENTLNALSNYQTDLENAIKNAKAEITSIFKIANTTDRIYKSGFGRLESFGEEVLNRQTQLTQIATPNNGVYTSLIGNGINGYDDLKKEMIFIASPDIDYDQLLEFCRIGGDANEWRTLMTDLSFVIYDMGIGEALLVAIFNHKDINLDNLLDRPAIEDLRKIISQNILEGTKGYPTPEEISKSLGIPKDMVVEYLNPSDYRNIPMPGTSQENHNYTLIELSEIQTKMDSYLNEMTNIVKNDDRMMSDILNKIGISEELYNSIKNGEIDGYKLKQYEKVVGNTLETIAGQEEFAKVERDVLKDLNSILGDVKGVYALHNTDEVKSAAMKKYLENGILSDKEAREFLKTYCGRDVATSSEITFIQTITSGIKTAGDAKKHIGEVLDGADKIAYWISDYEKELSMLDALEDMQIKDPTYAIALKEIRSKYEDKAYETLNSAVRDLVEKGIGEVEKNISPCFSIVETAISLGGKATGLSDFASAAVDVATLTGVNVSTIDCYEQAVNAVKNGDTSNEALSRVNTTYQMMKETMSSYYSAQIDYAKGSWILGNKNKELMSFLEYQKKLIDSSQIGEKIEVITYKEFLESAS